MDRRNKILDDNRVYIGRFRKVGKQSSNDIMAMKYDLYFRLLQVEREKGYRRRG